MGVALFDIKSGGNYSCQIGREGEVAVCIAVVGSSVCVFVCLSLSDAQILNLL